MERLREVVREVRERVDLREIRERAVGNIERFVVRLGERVSLPVILAGGMVLFAGEAFGMRAAMEATAESQMPVPAKTFLVLGELAVGLPLMGLTWGTTAAAVESRISGPSLR